MKLFTAKNKIPFEVDENDVEAISYYTWHIVKGYPATCVGRKNIRLHLFLLGRAPAGLEWDHQNRDKLDNRRSNLRAVTSVINYRNRGTRSDNVSQTRGVSWDSKNQLWIAEITNDRKRIFLGRFSDVELARTARLAAEDRLWGSER